MRDWIVFLVFVGMTVLPAVAAPSLDELILEAKEDLAHRLAMPVDEIELVDALETVWPDSSAGCPRARVAYLQVFTEGARITLRAAKLSYRYHSARGRKPFLCERLTWPVHVHGRRACSRTGCRTHASIVDN